MDLSFVSLTERKMGEEEKIRENAMDDKRTILSLSLGACSSARDEGRDVKWWFSNVYSDFNSDPDLHPT